VFLGVDWGAFVVVFLVALVATAVIVTAFAAGIRLFADGALDPVPDGPGASSPAAAAAPRARPLGATVAGSACFAVGVAAVLAGLWLIIPQFH